MSKLSFQFNLLIVIFSTLVAGGCAVEAAKVGDGDKPATVKKTDLQSSVRSATKTTQGATIEIEENSPADTVRVFYKKLRENRLREAVFLTNLRPAIEGLTDAELAELQVDLAPIAQQIPTEIQINGEIVAGDYATVTAKLPDNDTREMALQEIRLRKETNYWIILTVDEKSEGEIKKQGNKYFFNLRLQTHENDAKTMMNNISKAQMVHALQNGGNFGEMNALIEKGLLADDVRTAASTGYNYTISLSSDKKNYYATAEPAVYGKTGNVSYLLELDNKRNMKLTAKDNQGKSLKK